MKLASQNSRVLFLDRFYFPDEQATSVYLTELTEALQNRFQIEVLCGPPGIVTEKRRSSDPLTLSPLPLRGRGEGEGGGVHQVPCLRFPKSLLFARLLNDFSFLFMALLRGLFVPKPSLIISQTSPPGIWWIGFLLSRWHGSRWIHVSKDIFPDSLKVLSRSPNTLLISFLDQISSLPLKRADQIVVIGEDMRNVFLRKGFSSDRIFKIYDWVDLEFIRPLSKKNPFSMKYRIEDKFVVMYAGNFGRTHNFEDLLAAAEELRQTREIIFVLVGEGALKEKLAREVGFRELTNILTVSFEPRAKLPEVLAAADLSVILLKKGMAGLSVPSKIYSLLASGRPVLACVDPASDIARIVRESSSGFVIPPGNSTELAASIKTLFENRPLREELGNNARRFVEDRDFKASAFRRYGELFREVLNYEKSF